MQTHRKLPGSFQTTRRVFRDGFTLFELLVTLALVVTVMSVALVPIQTLTQSQGIDQATADLIHKLRTIQLAAIDSGSERVVEISSSGTGLKVGGGTVPPGSVDYELPAGFRLAVKTGGFGTEGLVFRPDGSAGDAILHLVDPNGKPQTIRIDRLTGLIERIREDDLASSRQGFRP